MVAGGPQSRGTVRHRGFSGSDLPVRSLNDTSYGRACLDSLLADGGNVPWIVRDGHFRDPEDHPFRGEGGRNLLHNEGGGFCPLPLVLPPRSDPVF